MKFIPYYLTNGEKNLSEIIEVKNNKDHDQNGKRCMSN